jgi:O-antigen ligase
MLSSQAIVRFLMSYMPVFSSGRHVVLTDGWVAQVPSFRANRSALVLVLCVWPAVLMVIAAGANRWVKFAAYAALVAGAVAVALSEHETSKVALVGSAFIFLAGRLSPSVTRWVVVAAWLVATGFTVPLAGYAYTQGLHQVSWLPYSAKDRIVIWQFTAEHIAEAPLLGAGIGGARGSAAEEEGEFAPGTRFPRRLSLHSHNAYLQVWFETGAVGAGLLFGTGLLVIGAIGTAPHRSQPYLNAAFAASALVPATSYSIWAPWFMANLALVPMLAVVGISLIKEGYAPDTCQWRQ